MALPIPCELYNLINDVESQSSALEETSFFSIWHDIFGIVAKHSALHDFGIALLHRHRHLPPEHVMVHEIDQCGQDVCRPEPLDIRRLYPVSYYLRDGSAFAYEFSPRPTPVPNAAFLADMTDFLGAHNLQDLVALSHIQDWGSTWLERMTDDMEGTLSVRCCGGHIIPQDQFIVTEWSFTATKHGPHMIALKGCAKQDNGGHLRTADEP